MFTGSEIAQALSQMEISHAIWLPDSIMGTWEKSLEASPTLQLIRVCREGEAWPLAAGLHLGGESPVVIMQTTGLFESSDAMRNVVFDLKLPIFAIVGARNWLVTGSQDSALRFTEPVMKAWSISHRLIATVDDKPKLVEHYHRCRQSNTAGAVLIAEGRE